MQGGATKDVKIDKNGKFYRLNNKGQRWSVRIQDIVASGLLRTPTTMDISDNAIKEAAKLMSGKSKRSSGEQVQITLAQQVMMDYLKDKPKLLESLNKEVQIIRKNPPSKDEFVDWIRTIDKKEMVDKTEIKKTTIDHWYRRDDAGFSLPSISDWCLIEANFDVPEEISDKMNELIELDWQRESGLLQTPSSNQRVEDPEEMRKRVEERGYNNRTKYNGLNSQLHHDPRWNHLLPTPRVGGEEGYETRAKRKGHDAAMSYLESNIDYELNHKMLPTPLAADCGEKACGNEHEQESVIKTFRNGGNPIKLNPLFIMEMMGFPITWTLMPFLKDRPEVHEGLFYNEGWDNFPISNPLCPKLNKDDFEDITTSKWRNESIKAGGNAIVPQVALQIFKVIQKIENE